MSNHRILLCFGSFCIVAIPFSRSCRYRFYNVLSKCYCPSYVFIPEPDSNLSFVRDFGLCHSFHHVVKTRLTYVERGTTSIQMLENLSKTLGSDGMCNNHLEFGVSFASCMLNVELSGRVGRVLSYQYITRV